MPARQLRPTRMPVPCGIDSEPSVPEILEGDAWYRRSGEDPNPAAREFRRRLEALAGEDFGTSSAPVLILYPRRVRAVGLLLACLTFVAAGILIVGAGEPAGYLVSAFFGLGAVVALVQLLPGSSYLRLDAEGFTFASLFRRTTIPWRAVDRLNVIELRQAGLRVHSMVAFDRDPSYDPGRLGTRLSRAVAGCDGALPDTYGMKPRELADLMSSSRERYRSRPRA